MIRQLGTRRGLPEATVPYFAARLALADGRAIATQFIRLAVQSGAPALAPTLRDGLEAAIAEVRLASGEALVERVALDALETWEGNQPFEQSEIVRAIQSVAPGLDPAAIEHEVRAWWKHQRTSDEMQGLFGKLWPFAGKEEG